MSNKMFRIAAECVSRQNLDNLVKDILSKGYYVDGYCVDPVFVGHVHILVEAKKKDIPVLEKIVWEYNGGNYCNIEEYVEDI